MNQEVKLAKEAALEAGNLILNYYKAAQAHYNNVIKAGLTEEAIVGAEFTEVEEEEVKAE